MRFCVYIVIAQHLLWACLLLLVPETQTRITAGIFPLRFFAAGSTQLLAVQYVVVSVAMVACIALKSERALIRKPKLYWGGLVVALFQQSLLTLSAVGSAVAIYRGRYLDGTVVSTGHLLGDQQVYILLALCHFVSLIAMYHVPLVKLLWNSRS